MPTEIILEIPFDAIALDRDNNIVLLIQIKPKPYYPDRKIEFFLKEVKKYLQVSHLPIPFAMFVDIEEIQVFNLNAEHFEQPALILKTADVMKVYHLDFSEKIIYQSSLIGMLNLWVDDLKNKQKVQNAPAAKELKAIGLLEKLENGLFRSGEVYKW